MIYGAAMNDALGWSISSAGDVNKDNIDDIIIGAPLASASGGRTNAGIAYVIYGRAGGFGTNIDLANALPISQGFKIIGSALGDQLGISVRAARDVNNDSIDDIIVGALQYAPTVPSTRTNAGAAYVIYGVTNGRIADVDLMSALLISDGFQIMGGAQDDYLGVSVGGAGDVNNDGIDDIIIGAHSVDYTTPSRFQAGAAYIIYGKQNGPTAAYNLVNPLALTDGFQVSGANTGDFLAYAVSGAGDVNNDGYSDVIISGHCVDYSGRANAGTAYIIYGKPTAQAVDIDLNTPLTLSQGFMIMGGATSDYLSYSVGAAGDVNKDGVDDVIVGAKCEAPSATPLTYAGIAYVIYGKEGGLTANIDLNNPLTVSQGFRISGGTANNRLGYSVRPAGDVNNDGVDDVIVGAIYDSRTGRTNGGAAFVVYSPFCATANCIKCKSGRCQLCSEDYRLYVGNGKCYYYTDCPFGTSANATNCIDTLLDTVNTVQSKSSQVASAVASSVTIITYTSPGSMIFASMADTLKYMKFMNITFPPRLQYVLDQPDPVLYSIKYISDPPDELQDQITNRPLADNFEKYDTSSSFLINLWTTLVTLLMIIIGVLIAYIGSYLTSSCKSVNIIFNKLKEVAKWNYLIGTFTGAYGSIAFYSVFELTTVQFDSNWDILSFSICLVSNIAFLIVSIKIVLIIIELSRKNNSRRIFRLKRKFKDYQIIFEDFEGGSFSRQGFFMISYLRLYLFYLVLGYLYAYPLAQAIVFTIQGLLFFFYLVIKRPFKGRLELIEAVLLELILEVVHGSVLGLAINQQQSNSTTSSFAIHLGDIVIVCISAFVFVQCFFLGLQVLVVLITILKLIYHKIVGEKASSKELEVSNMSGSTTTANLQKDTQINQSTADISHVSIEPYLPTQYNRQINRKQTQEEFMNIRPRTIRRMPDLPSKKRITDLPEWMNEHPAFRDNIREREQTLARREAKILTAAQLERREIFNWRYMKGNDESPSKLKKLQKTKKAFNKPIK